VKLQIFVRVHLRGRFLFLFICFYCTYFSCSQSDKKSYRTKPSHSIRHYMRTLDSLRMSARCSYTVRVHGVASIALPHYATRSFQTSTRKHGGEISAFLSQDSCNISPSTCDSDRRTSTSATRTHAIMSSQTSRSSPSACLPSFHLR